jgi:hypothetical protein
MLSGCALLKVPLYALNMVSDLLGQVFSLASKLPMPPPGVFF